MNRLKEYVGYFIEYRKIMIILYIYVYCNQTIEAVEKRKTTCDKRIQSSFNNE